MNVNPKGAIIMYLETSTIGQIIKCTCMKIYETIQMSYTCFDEIHLHLKNETYEFELKTHSSIC